MQKVVLRKLKSAAKNKLVRDLNVSLSFHFEMVYVAVERFHSFREVHSLEWHAHRHELGQAFLDRFVRQVCFLT